MLHSHRFAAGYSGRNSPEVHWKPSPARARTLNRNSEYVLKHYLPRHSGKLRDCSYVRYDSRFRRTILCSWNEGGTIVRTRMSDKYCMFAREETAILRFRDKEIIWLMTLIMYKSKSKSKYCTSRGSRTCTPEGKYSELICGSAHFGVKSDPFWASFLLYLT